MQHKRKLHTKHVKLGVWVFKVVQFFSPTAMQIVFVESDNVHFITLLQIIEILSSSLCRVFCVLLFAAAD